MSVLSRRTTQTDSHAARKAETEARILNATTALLAEGNSFADLSIGRIASGAEISRSAFYDYFADKRALVLRLTEEVTSGLVAEALSWEGSDLELVDALPAILASVAGLYTEHPEVLRAITEAANYDEVMAEWWHEHLSLIITAAEARLESETWQRTDGDRPDITACAIVWMVQQTCYQELVLNRRFTAEEVVDVLTRLVVGALALHAPDRSDSAGRG